MKQPELATALGTLSAKGVPVHRLAVLTVAQLQSSLLAHTRNISLLEALCRELPLGEHTGLLCSCLGVHGGASLHTRLSCTTQLRKTLNAAVTLNHSSAQASSEGCRPMAQSIFRPALLLRLLLPCRGPGRCSRPARSRCQLAAGSSGGASPAH